MRLSIILIATSHRYRVNQVRVPTQVSFHPTRDKNVHYESTLSYRDCSSHKIKNRPQAPLSPVSRGNRDTYRCLRPDRDDLSKSNEVEYNSIHINMPSISTQVHGLVEFCSDYARDYHQIEADCQTFKTIAALVRYGRAGVGLNEEYNSWRGMFHRSKQCGYSLSPEFSSYQLFLRHVGPKPERRSENPFSLDRINNATGYV